MSEKLSNEIGQLLETDPHTLQAAYWVRVFGAYLEASSRIIHSRAKQFEKPGEETVKDAADSKRSEAEVKDFTDGVLNQAFELIAKRLVEPSRGGYLFDVHDGVTIILSAERPKDLTRNQQAYQSLLHIAEDLFEELSGHMKMILGHNSSDQTEGFWNFIKVVYREVGVNQPNLLTALNTNDELCRRLMKAIETPESLRRRMELTAKVFSFANVERATLLMLIMKENTPPEAIEHAQRDLRVNHRRITTLMSQRRLNFQKAVETEIDTIWPKQTTTDTAD